MTWDFTCRVQLLCSALVWAVIYLYSVLDSNAVSVFAVILVEFDKSKTSRLVYSVFAFL